MSKIQEELELLYRDGNGNIIKIENRIAMVNDIPLCYPDFGILKHEKAIDIEWPQFTPGPSTERVLEKYGITEEEYQVISQVMLWYLKGEGEHFTMRKSFWQDGFNDFKPV